MKVQTKQIRPHNALHKARAEPRHAQPLSASELTPLTISARADDFVCRTLLLPGPVSYDNAT